MTKKDYAERNHKGNTSVDGNLTVTGFINGNGAGDWLNAKSYGAVGDGTTDDTNALQACINDAAAQGKVAYIPKGAYLVSLLNRDIGNGVMEPCGLYLPSNTRLVGDGPGPRTFRSQDPGGVFGWPDLGQAATNPSEYTGMTDIHTTSTMAGSIIASINTRRVSIEGLAVYGMGKALGNTLHGIKFGYFTDTVDPKMNSVPFYINCTDVWVTNCSGDGFRNQTVCVSSFRNCIASEIGGVGFNHPEGSTSCTYISCWARSCVVGWRFQDSMYINLSGCATDYCNTSYWVSAASTIGFYGCGSEFPQNTGVGNNLGYSWRFDQNANTCTLSSCIVVGNPRKGIWITDGANRIALINVSEVASSAVTTGTNFVVADANTTATLLDVRNDKPNLLNVGAIVNIFDDNASTSVNVGRDLSITRDLIIPASAGNLFLKPQTPGRLPFFNAGSAVLSSKIVYDDTTGTLAFPANTAAIAPVRIAHGVAPTVPVNGDMWTTSAGLFVRINGVTKSVNLT